MQDSPDDTGNSASPRPRGVRRQWPQQQRSYPEDIEDNIGPPLVPSNSSPSRPSRQSQRVAHQLPPIFTSHARGRHGGSSDSHPDADIEDLHDDDDRNPRDPFVDPAAPPPDPAYIRSRRESRYADIPLDQRRARSQSRNRRHSRSITSNGSSRGPPRYSSARTPSRTRHLRRLSEDYGEAYPTQPHSAVPRTPRTARGSVRGCEAFPPLPDSRMSLSPAEEDLEDPRVRVLLEALRITKAQEQQAPLPPPPPPPETVRGSTLIDLRTATRGRDNSDAERGVGPIDEKSGDHGAWVSTEEMDEKAEPLDKNLVSRLKAPRTITSYWICTHMNQDD